MTPTASHTSSPRLTQERLRVSSIGATASVLAVGTHGGDLLLFRVHANSAPASEKSEEKGLRVAVLVEARLQAPAVQVGPPRLSLAPHR